jgi:hypothetical protein
MLLLKVSFDGTLVISYSGGLLSVEDVHSYGAALPLAMASARSATGRVRHLVLAQNAVVQPPDVMEAFIAVVTHSDGVDDRMAVVAASVLAKMQAERNLVKPKERAFLNEAEARAWLAE